MPSGSTAEAAWRYPDPREPHGGGRDRQVRMQFPPAASRANCDRVPSADRAAHYLPVMAPGRRAVVWLGSGGRRQSPLAAEADLRFGAAVELGISDFSPSSRPP